MEENKKEGFRGDEYYGGVMLLEIPINLFELPKQFKLMVHSYMLPMNIIITLHAIQ